MNRTRRPRSLEYGENEALARPRRTGLKAVRKSRPDGTAIEYFYDRRSGTFLGHDRDVAIRLARENDDTKTDRDPYSIAWLITRWLERPEFKSLAPRTQKLYRKYLDEMRTRWGDRPFRAFDVNAVEEIKAALQNTPRKANQVIALFRILFGYAVKLRKVPVNPVLRPEMLPTPPRRRFGHTPRRMLFSPLPGRR